MTQQDYKQSIITLSQTLGRFPRIQELADTWQVQKQEVSKILSHLVTNGFLKRKGRTWYEITISNTSTLGKSNIFKKVGAVGYENTLPPTIQVFDRSFYFIRYSMLIIGIGAAILSTYYTKQWIGTYANTFISWLLASILVLFSVISFETILFMLKNKRTFLVIVSTLAFTILFGVTILFSVLSTVGGQYEKQIAVTKNISATSSSLSINKIQLDNIKEKRADLQKQKDTLSKQLSPLLTVLENISTVKSSDIYLLDDTLSNEQKRNEKTYIDTQNKVDSLNKQIKTLDTDIDKTRVDENKLLETSPDIVNEEKINAPDFYQWLAKVLNIDKGKVRFWLNLFPSVFLDIVSPASLAIFLFLKKKIKV